MPEVYSEIGLGSFIANSALYPKVKICLFFVTYITAQSMVIFNGIPTFISTVELNDLQGNQSKAY